MKTRVAKAILNTILWSAILAGVSCLFWLDWGRLIAGDFSTLIAPGFYTLIAPVAFTSGLIAFALYDKIRIGGIAGSILNVLAWSVVLALYGGIYVSSLGVWMWLCIDGECGPFGVHLIVIGSVPTSLIAGLITFTAYELSKRVRFVRKKEAKSHRLVHP